MRRLRKPRVEVAPERLIWRSDRQRPKQQKTWADNIGIKTGVVGETIDGVLICEGNRATVFEYHRAGIEILLRITRQNYLRKSVPAVLCGIPTFNPELPNFKYAVYVRSGFLRDVPEDEVFTPRKRERRKPRQKTHTTSFGRKYTTA